MSIYDSIIEIEKYHEDWPDIVIVEGKMIQSVQHVEAGTHCIIAFFPYESIFQIVDDQGKDLVKGSYKIVLE